MSGRYGLKRLNDDDAAFTMFVLCTSRVHMCVLFKAQWEPESEPNQHCSQMLVNHVFKVFGHDWHLLDVHVVARQVKFKVGTQFVHNFL